VRRGQHVGIVLTDTGCNLPHDVAVRRVVVTAVRPDDVIEGTIALTKVSPVREQLAVRVRDQVRVPTLAATAVAQIGRHEQHHESEITCAAEYPVRVCEVGVIRRREISTAREGRRVVEVPRCVTRELVVDEIHQQRVEAACGAILQIQLRILTAEIRDQRPGCIAMHEEGLAVCIDQVAPVR
jgi:hypothetical protein